MPETTNNALLKTMQNLYIKEDYDALISSILENKDKLKPGLFHYNLGTTYLKSGQLAAGRYNLEKAMKLGYVNPMVMNNLKYSIKELGVRDISTEPDQYPQFINGATIAPMGAYLFVTLLLMIIVVFSRKMRWLRSNVLTGVLVALSLLPIAAYQFHIKDIKVAIALKEIPVKEGPSKIYEDVGNIEAGAKIILGKLYEGWYFVDFPEKDRGWVKKENLAFY